MRITFLFCNYTFRFFLFIFIFFAELNILDLYAFGKNKVITKDFKWEIYEKEHFEVYHYDIAGKNLLPYVDIYLDNAYNRVQSILPIEPKNKFPFFLYNNHNEFEQSNIVSIGEGTGGVTEAYKSRFMVAHLGSQRYLEYVITHELMHEIEFEYFLRGFWRSIRILKMVIYPNWLMEGLSEYGTGDLDSTTREMYLRDAATSNRLLPLDHLESFNHLLPHQVTLGYKESEALIKYLIEEYGQESIPRLVNTFIERFDANSVLLAVYGINLNTLDRKFREYLEDKYSIYLNNLEEPSLISEQITFPNAYPQFCQSGVFTPDGKNVIYLSDKDGSDEIYIINLETKKSQKLLNLSRTIKIENIHTDGWGLSISSDGTKIVFAGERQQKDYLYIYYLKLKRLIELDPGIQTISSPCFSLDSSKIYFSGMEDGFRDIYVYDINTTKTSRLTYGAFDEIDINIMPDDRRLIFAAEREGINGRIEYDICMLDLSTGTTSFITNLVGDERYPVVSNDGKYFYFTSDMDGIYDIYRYSFVDNNIKRITKVIGGNFQPRISPCQNKILFSSYRKGERHLYIKDIKNEELYSYIGNFYLESYPNSRFDLKDINMQNRFKPYRFKISTDLFFPVLFYSTLDGLFITTYWQLSDFLGNHQLQSIFTFASASEYLNYQIQYGFIKYRPQIYIGLKGDEYFEDISRNIKWKENQQSIMVSYPFNRFQRVELIGGTIYRTEQWINRSFEKSFEDWSSRENICGLFFYHDTVRGPYLEPTSGYRLGIGVQNSGDLLGGDYRYNTLLFEGHNYLPLGKEHLIGIRTFVGGSSGRDAQYFRLGGIDRVRGYKSDLTVSGHNIIINTFEWRIPVVHNINYHMWYIFPDFFFKTFYTSIFFDMGYIWNYKDEFENIKDLSFWKASYGLGLKFYTFILEEFTLLLHFQFARPIDTNETVFYFSFGSTF